jgi:hypothetical protein
LTTNRLVNTYNERRPSNTMVTFYSIESFPHPVNNNTDNDSTISKAPSVERHTNHTSLSTVESKLIRGGLTGLQNLGNTVKICQFKME